MTDPSDKTYARGETLHSACLCCEHAAKEIERINAENRTLRNMAVRLADALDAYRFYIDAAAQDLIDAHMTRDDALDKARKLDPYDGITPSVTTLRG